MERATPFELLDGWASVLVRGGIDWGIDLVREFGEAQVRGGPDCEGLGDLGGGPEGEDGAEGVSAAGGEHDGVVDESPDEPEADGAGDDAGADVCCGDGGLGGAAGEPGGKEEEDGYAAEDGEPGGGGVDVLFVELFGMAGVDEIAVEDHVDDGGSDEEDFGEEGEREEEEESREDGGHLLSVIDGERRKNTDLQGEVSGRVRATRLVFGIASVARVFVGICVIGCAIVFEIVNAEAAFGALGCGRQALARVFATWAEVEPDF